MRRTARNDRVFEPRLVGQVTEIGVSRQTHVVPSGTQRRAQSEERLYIAT